MPEIKPEDFVRIATLFVPEAVAAQAFAPSGGYLAVAAGARLVIYAVPPGLGASTALLQQESFPRLATIEMPDTVQSICFTPDGKVIAVSIADKVHLYKMPV